MTYRVAVKSVVPGLETKTDNTSNTDGERPDETPLSPNSQEAKLKVCSIQIHELRG